MNISVEQVYEDGFVAEVIALLAAKQIPPQRLCIELTESSMIKDTQTVTECMHALRSAGVSFSLDDFVVPGYSSLAYLKSLPIQEKLSSDLRFVRDMFKTRARDAGHRQTCFCVSARTRYGCHR